MTPKETVLAITVAEELIQRFEGCYLRPYLCPAAKPTIGFGATFYPDGTRVRLTDPPITVERAKEILRLQVIGIFLPTVRKLCPGVDDPRRLAAIIDWTFNLGGGNLQVSTMRRRINSGDWAGAKVECMKWVYAAGKRLKGLVNRRQAEVELM